MIEWIIVWITVFILTIWFFKRRMKKKKEIFVPVMKEKIEVNGVSNEYFSVGNQKFDNLDNAKEYARRLKDAQ